MDPGWLSNAYVAAPGPRGNAIFVDSGAPLEPLFAVVEREQLTPTHLLTTHTHVDHVAGHEELIERFGVEVATGSVETAGIRVQALATPGHSDDGVSFLVNDLFLFSGDTLFKDAVGGGDAGQVRTSVMDVLMQLPLVVRVLPGHTDETTIGREREHNPFIRVWRGLDPEGTERVRVGGRDATLVIWSPDYDGKGKALVQFEDGEELIVGGSKVERL